MVATVDVMERVFRFNGMTLPDPGAHIPLEQVKMFFATNYPELTVAVIEGPVAQGKKLVYEFRQAVGTKG